MSKRRVLFICGSLNQTTQLHQVAKELREYEQRFTPFYGDAVVDWMRRRGLIETTIGGEKRRKWCTDYLEAHGLAIDLHGRSGGYDLVVTCTDMVVPKNVRHTKLVVVQEGILDPEGLEYAIVTRLKFIPRWCAGTATTGMSYQYDKICVASEGYRAHFLRHGVEAEKIAVTGIPNFDACERYRDNDFPHRGYVLVCTSDTRETFKLDSRARLIRRALRIAAGRQLVFKLHPNENAARRAAEILRIAPNALVYASGSAEEMIANCEVLITQWSSTVFVGMALGKEVHTNFDLGSLKPLVPIQNGGTSARRIADVCRELLESQPKSRASREARP